MVASAVQAWNEPPSPRAEGRCVSVLAPGHIPATDGGGSNPHLTFCTEYLQYR